MKYNLKRISIYIIKKSNSYQRPIDIGIKYCKQFETLPKKRKDSNPPRVEKSKASFEPLRHNFEAEEG